MKSGQLFFLSLFMIIAFSCTPENADTDKNSTDTQIPDNPPAEGFNLSNSDAQAIEVADEVMQAMGGRANWDNTRYLCWNFFGFRELIWDKWTGDVRIESMRDSSIYLLNINNMDGRVMVKGEEVTDSATLNEKLQRGKSIWINDSYWLVMPYKLKDSGVTLKYLREDTTQTGIPSDVLQLTFENVGDTPDNRYEVWVDKEENLVRQWAYYRYDSLKDPGFITPWADYAKYNKILLSGNRGERSLDDIMVFDELPESIFTSFDSVNLENFN